jgi:HlyD family secretion protein
MKVIPLRFIAAAALLAVPALQTGCGQNKEKKGKQPDQLYEVVRGNFNIVISANGALDAIKRYQVTAPPVGKKGLDIIEAVEDQSILKQGDLVVAFSDEAYLEELESQEIQIEEAEKNLMLIEQDFQMKIADSVSQIKKATDTQRVSLEALEKYVKEDAPLQKKNFQQSVETAQNNVEDQRAVLSDLQVQLLSASMGDEAARLKLENQIEAAKQKLATLENTAERAAYDLRIFKQYTYPQKSRDLERNVVKAEMDLQKELVNATAQRVQLEGKIQTQQRTLRTKRKQRDDTLNTVRQLRVTAPVDGVLTYGDPDPRKRHRQQKEIAVGTSMRPSELIGTIPDLSRLIVNVDIPETSRSKVEVGMRAEMRIKALSNIRLSGEVSRISDLASHMNFWDRSSPKIYPTVLSLDQIDLSLRPGMTVEIDLISEEIRDVIYVPVEALSVREGVVTCRVKKVSGTEKRKVTVGKSSDSFVEVVDGLEEGESILVSREDL